MRDNCCLDIGALDSRFAAPIVGRTPSAACVFTMAFCAAASPSLAAAAALQHQLRAAAVCCSLVTGTR